MAVSKTMENRAIQRKELNGVDGMGKQIYKSRTISNINHEMADADMLQFNKLIDSLVNNNGYILFEKISNSITEV
ncbi:DUF1659 domain-containing protein [Proteocatella sphenisci]|uniref:DUF1659 domain-containing protein n=1 Tax=Proteocatella sphenisci TaxID=181070 RepID=UPI00048B33C1|nr:DUF1659 domain-containing protein [Proteocatella sphenisci]